MRPTDTRRMIGWSILWTKWINPIQMTDVIHVIRFIRSRGARARRHSGPAGRREPRFVRAQARGYAPHRVPLGAPKRIGRGAAPARAGAVTPAGAGGRDRGAGRGIRGAARARGCEWIGWLRR